MIYEVVVLNIHGLKQNLKRFITIMRRHDIYISYLAWIVLILSIFEIFALIFYYLIIKIKHYFMSPYCMEQTIPNKIQLSSAHISYASIAHTFILFPLWNK